MSYCIYPQAFNPYALLQARQDTLAGGSFGACASFVGSMRDMNTGHAVSHMLLEHYPQMMDKQLAKIEAEAHARWALQDVLIAHRTGQITPGEPIVLTACWSQHRKEALSACEFLIEQLKHRAPFWKCETRSGGDRHWVVGEVLPVE